MSRRALQNGLIVALIVPYVVAFAADVEFWPITNYPMYSTLTYNLEHIDRFGIYAVRGSGAGQSESPLDTQQAFNVPDSVMDYALGGVARFWRLPQWDHYRRLDGSFYRRRAEALYEWYQRAQRQPIAAIRIYVNRYRIAPAAGQIPQKVALLAEYPQL